MAPEVHEKRRVSRDPFGREFMLLQSICFGLVGFVWFLVGLVLVDFRFGLVFSSDLAGWFVFCWFWLVGLVWFLV